MYGNPEVTTGGRALKFYSSMRIDVRKVELIKGTNGEFIGSRTRAKIVKNKVAPPFKEAEFDIMYGTGISKEGEILDMAVKLGIVKKGGSWFSYGDRRLGQGRDNVKRLIKSEPELAADIESKVTVEMAKLAESTKSKYEAKVSPKAETDESEEKEVKKSSYTRASAKAKLDIAVEDDED